MIPGIKCSRSGKGLESSTAHSSFRFLGSSTVGGEIPLASILTMFEGFTALSEEIKSKGKMLPLAGLTVRREETGELDLSFKSLGMPGMSYKSNLSV